MGNTVDERIVQMQFDNRQFEDGIKTSLKSIDNLKTGLNFDGATKGLNNIQAASNDLSLSSIAESVDTIASKFSALGIVGVTALANLANAAVNAGKKLVMMFTIDPIKAGFQEYETQMKAVQTILANTQNQTKKVDQQQVKAINETAQKRIVAAQESAQKDVELFRDAQQEKAEIFAKKSKEEVKAFQKKQQEEAKILQAAVEHDGKLIKDNHDAKLKLYEEEFMAKLKVIDEERYNRIKALDDQIKGLNDLTEAEEEELRKAEERANLEELQKNFDRAITVGEKKRAEEALNKYKEQLSRKQLLKDRSAQIDSLELAKTAVETEYETKRKALETEYNDKLTKENEFFAEEQRQLAENFKTKTTNMQAAFEKEKELFDEQQAAQRKAFKKQQEEEAKAYAKRQEQALEDIEIRKNAEIKALTEAANTSVGKPTTLKDVNNALDELNEYADKTIYNFTEMTKNIGTFTAAGVDLDTSVSAIKGIANLAAVSGSTSQQASTAMYQLSQAMSSGTVKLMDWNSVVNAGMGGQVFQNALKETAKVHGIAIDDIIVNQGSFRESLSEGWLTTELLTETLSKFTGDLTDEQLKSMGYTEEQIKKIQELGEMSNDAATKVKTFTQLMDTLKEAAQSGWAQSWRLIIGDFEEAKEVFTEMSDKFGGMIGASAEARNALLKGGLSTGWNQFLDEGIADEAAYQEAILKVAKANGVATETIAKIEDGTLAFKESLESGWLTADILTESLNNLAGETNSMSEEQLKNAGYTKKQVEQLNNFNQRVQEGVVDMDEFSTKIGRLSGRMNIIEGLRNILDSLLDIFRPIKEAFEEIFPPMTGDQLYEITERFREFTEKLKPSADAIKVIKNVFKGLFSVFKAVGKVFKFVTGIIGKIIKAILPSKDTVGGIVTDIGDFFAKLEEKTKGLDTIFAKISEFVDKVAVVVKEKIGIAIDFFKGLFEDVKTFIEPIVQTIKDKVVSIFEGFKNSTALADIKLFMDDLVSKVREGIDTVVKKFDDLNIMEKIKGFLEPIVTKIRGLFSKESIGEVDTKGLKRFKRESEETFSPISLLIEKIKEGFAKVKEWATPVIDWIKEAWDKIKGFFAKLFPDGVTLNDVLNAGAIVVVITTIKKFVDSIGSIAKSAAGVLDGLRSTLETYQMTLKADVLMKIATAIAVLVASLLVLSLINPDKLMTAVGAITVLFAELIGSFALFQKSAGSAKGTQQSAMALVLIAGAILLMSIALAKISGINFDNATNGLLALGGLVLIVLGILKSLTTMSGKGTTSKQVLEMAGALIVISLALQFMAGAIEKLAKIVSFLGAMDPDQLMQGMGALTGMFGMLILFIKKSKVEKLGAKQGIGFTLLALGLVILAGAVSIFGNMDPGALIQGGLAVGGLLTVLGLFLKLAGNATQALAAGAAVGIIAIGLMIMAKAIVMLGVLDPNVLKQASIIIVALLAVLTLMFALTKGLNAMLVAEAIVLIAGAMLVFAIAFEKLGKGSWKGAGIGLLTLAGIFLIIAGAVAILTPMLGPMLLITGSLITIATAILLFAIALQILSVVGAAAAGAIALIFAAVTAAIVPFVIAIGFGIIKLVEVLADGATRLTEALWTLISAMVDRIVEGAPEILGKLLKMLESLLLLLLEWLPKLRILGYQVLIEFLTGIRDNIKELATMAAEIVMALITGILDGIANRIGDVIASAVNLFIQFINGLADAINNQGDLILEACENLIMAIVNGIGKVIGKLAPKAKEMIDTIIATLKEEIPKIWGKIKQKFSDLITSAYETVKDWAQAGRDWIQGLIDGIREWAGKIWQKVKDAFGDALQAVLDFFGISSPSTVFMEIGKNLDLGLAEGLSKYADVVSDEAINVGDDAITGLSKTMAQIGDIVNDDMELTPSIRPVIDLSDVKIGEKQISDMLSKRRGLNISSVVKKLPTITTPAEILANQNQNQSLSEQQKGSISFTQNNYSPAALSRLEIYRQTRNQLSMVRGMVNNP